MIDGFLNIANGQIQNYSAFQKKVAGLSEGRYYFTIERKNKRTNQQNRYYFGCVCQIVLQGLRDAGWNEFETVDEVHESLKAMFLKKQLPNNDGVVMEKIISTTKLSTIEFNEYVDKIAKWAAEYLGCYVPAPNEQSKFQYE